MEIRKFTCQQCRTSVDETDVKWDRALITGKCVNCGFDYSKPLPDPRRQVVHNHKKSHLDIYRIYDLSSCERAIRNGGIAAMVSAGMTATFAIAGFFATSTDTDLRYFIDPWNLIDAITTAIIGVFVFRKSQIATVLLLLQFTVSKLIMWDNFGRVPGLVVSVIFFITYFTALRGTVLWHSIYKDQASPSKVCIS